MEATLPSMWHDNSKASDIKPISSTCQGGGAEGGYGRFGGSDGCFGVGGRGDVVVTNAVEIIEWVRGLWWLRKKRAEETRVRNIFRVCFGKLSEAGFQIPDNLRRLFAIVELNAVEAHLGQELLEGAITGILEFRVLPPIFLAALPVNQRHREEYGRKDAEEDGGVSRNVILDPSGGVVGEGVRGAGRYYAVIETARPLVPQEAFKSVD
ncbi:phosphoenolpyruvate carboxylase [Babesia caballi]|uniref:Phosphoenolpyruvate carboxylase n=1 Tax=Babesia caballi TaxID=5871 RepID=A0AAV4M0I2_BABCB|nr:phosphoenolpyruvate carboxylase [Babesia caballi]